ASEFIYQTPFVAFTNPFTPLITYSDVVNIQAGQEALDRALDDLFAYLLFGEGASGGSLNVRVACRYGYELAVATVGGGATSMGSAPTLTTFLPLRLLPRFDFQLSEQWRQTFTSRLATVLTNWEQT